MRGGSGIWFNHLLNAFSGRFSWNVPPGGDSGKDQGENTGEATYLGGLRILTEEL